MMQKLVGAKLDALQYPHKGAFALESESKVAQLVLWLENRKIRQYPPAERSGLNYEANAGGWAASFKKYLVDLDCPVSEGEDALAKQVHWLVCHAVSLDYFDSAAEINAAVAASNDSPSAATTKTATQPPHDSLGSAGGGTKPKLTTNSNSSSSSSSGDNQEEIASILDQILATLQMSSATVRGLENNKEKARVVYQTIQRIQDAQDLRSQQTNFKTKMFPLGFQTKDDITNEASTIMRMLYVEDLRDLQRSVNAMLSHAQTFTANPKTNSRLGKVGR